MNRRLPLHLRNWSDTGDSSSSEGSAKALHLLFQVGMEKKVVHPEFAVALAPEVARFVLVHSKVTNGCEYYTTISEQEDIEN